MKILLISMVLQISLLCASGDTVYLDMEPRKVLPDTNNSKKVFRTFGIGIGRIDLSNDFHKSFSTASKIGYKYETFNMYLFGNSNIYKHLGEYHSLSMIGLGFSTNPFSNEDITLGIGIGIGMNLRASKLFSDFKESFDFGFAHALEIDYAINTKWSLLLTYKRYYLNTNNLQLENAKPEIITFNIIYAFDM